MALLPKVKLKTLVSFPANILDGIGVDVVKQNGSYQFNLAYDDFAPPVSGETLPDAAHLTSLLWNSTTDSYVLTPISLLGGQGGVANPLMDGAVQPGTALTFSHEDHRHPTDTTLVSKSANLSDVVDVTTSRKNLYAAPFDAMAYSGMQINGSMEVSQENGTTSINTNGKYICDGWLLSFTAAPISISAAMFTNGIPGISNSIGLAVAGAQPSLAAGDTVGIQNRIEGYRVARLAWGTANAQPITISFWTAHHRVGTYSCGVRQGAGARSYQTTYTQNAADTWEFKTVTIPGDTLGTWDKINGVGMIVDFAMACGTTNTIPVANTWTAGNYSAAPGQVNGVAATSDVFRLTGVVVLPGIEAPSAARSALIMRPYDQELLTCMRYWRKFTYVQGAYMPVVGASIYATNALSPLMRATPTIAVVGTPIVTNVASINRFAGPDFFDHELTNTAIGGVYWNGSISLDARL